MTTQRLRQDVLADLRFAGRKLAWTRSAERAGMVVTAGALAVAAVLTGWALAPHAPWAAWALCLLPVAVGVGIAGGGWVRAVLSTVAMPSLTRPQVPRRRGGDRPGRPAMSRPRSGSLRAYTAGSPPLFRDRAEALWAAAALAAPALAGAVLLGLGMHLRVPPLVWALGVPSAMGLLAGGVRAMRGAGVLAAGRFLDERHGLRERLATAGEIALAPRDAAPSETTVLAQAAEILRTRRPQRAPMWQRTRTTAAAVACAVLLAVAVAAVSPAPVGDDTARLAGSLDELTDQQLARLAAALRAAASDPALRDRLLAAARLVEARNEEQLQRVLEQLQAEGYRPLETVPADILAAAGVGGGGQEPRRGGGSEDDVPAPDDQNPSEDLPASGGVVRLYDPQYADVAPAPALAGQRPATPYRPYDDAWSAARRRAADALRQDTVVPEYRPILREFFRDPDVPPR